MRAISLWQPWATLVAIGAKQFETRSWPTTYRGPLIIHAAKHLERADCFREEIAIALAEASIRKASEIPLGAYLCVVELAECYTTEVAIGRSLVQGREIAFGDYSANRYAWKLTNLRVFPEPIPANGQRGFWDPLKGIDPAMKRTIESIF